MLRCNVHNLVTGQRYEFTAADQAEIDARLERKAGVYGINPEVSITNIDAELETEARGKANIQEAKEYFATLDWSLIEDTEARKAIRHLWRLIKQ
jgi:hypothetical protein